MTVFEWLFKYPPRAFAEGTLVFLAGLPGEWLLLVYVLAAAGLWLLYRQVTGKVSRRTWWVLAVLRVLVVGLVLFLLGMPALRSRESDRTLFVPVLVDASRSMSIQDVKVGGAASSRLDAAKALVYGAGARGGLIDQLGKADKDVQVLVYGFAQGASRVADAGRLKADGPFTNVLQSVREMEEELGALPVIGVVMVTDGCRNAGGAPEDAARLLKGRAVRLFTVGVGDPKPPRDYEVVRVFAPRRIRRNTEVEVFATVRHTDFAEPFEVRVMRGDNVVHKQTVTPSPRSDLERLRVAFTPDHGDGAATYRLLIPAAAGEKVTDNNHKDFVLEVSDDRLPVLYVEGSPRLEYRFLKRALFRDRDFRLVGLLRLAKDRFYIQGADPTEAYLEKGFPATREQLFAFEAVVLGDIEAGYFSPEQLAMLEEFVSKRGGGLLMLGGVNSLGLGKYDGTPVGRMLPAAVSATDPPYADAEFASVVDPKGLEHPLMRLVPDPEINRLMWESVPRLIGITPVKGVKAGATAMLRRQETGQPLLLAQDYGQGRAAVFTSGGSWYWQMSMPAENEFQEKFWKQMIRWLVVGAKERVSVELASEVYARKDPVNVKVRVLRKDLTPVNDAKVTATLTNPEGNKEDVPMDWTLSEEGVYQCQVVPDQEGAYKVTAAVEEFDPQAGRYKKWDLEPAEAGFEVSEPFVEFSNAGLKEELLKDMAQTTGGRYFAQADAGQVAQELTKLINLARRASDKPEHKELWDMPALFLLGLVLVSAEWLIRRKAGLA